MPRRCYNCLRRLGKEEYGEFRMSEENVSIEDLRSAVENEHRFPTAIRGFDKKAVKILQKLGVNAVEL